MVTATAELKQITMPTNILASFDGLIKPRAHKKNPKTLQLRQETIDTLTSAMPVTMLLKS